MFAPDDALPRHGAADDRHDAHASMLDVAAPIVAEERMRFDNAARRVQ